jgi:hypothetical protein
MVPPSDADRLKMMLAKSSPNRTRLPLIVRAICIGSIFLGILFLGWSVGHFGPHPIIFLPPNQQQEKQIEKNMMTLNVSAYNKNGEPIRFSYEFMDSTMNTKIPVIDIHKWTGNIGLRMSINVKPDDTSSYQNRIITIEWRTKEQFIQWLNTDFQQELHLLDVDIQRWQPILQRIKASAGQVSCVYPVIIDSKSPAMGKQVTIQTPRIFYPGKTSPNERK